MKLAGVSAFAAALALAVAGCGGSDTSATESASSAPAQSAPSGQPPQFDQDAFTQLRQCLEENGVTLPSPGQQGAPPSGMQGGPPTLSEDAQKAFEACGEYLPSAEVSLSLRPWRWPAAQPLKNGTSIARLAGESGIEVESMVRLVAALRPLDASQLNDAALITAAQMTEELDGVIFPLNKKSTRKEPFHWPNMLSRWAPVQLVRSLTFRVRDRFTATLRAKRAVACLLWMSSQSRTVIERALIQFGGARTAAGPIQAVASRTCDVLPVVARTAEILHPGTDLTEQTDALLVCLEIGLPKELAPLGLAVGRTLSRGEYLQLLTAALGTPEALRSADDEVLEQVLGSVARVQQLRRDLSAYLKREADKATLAALISEVDAAA